MNLFPLIATGNYFPQIVGILFIIGLISSAYSAAGSALTALTTSFTVDILGTKGRTEEEIVKIRKRVHIGMAVIMGITIFVFNLLNNTSVIDAVYILASYIRPHSRIIRIRYIHETTGSRQIYPIGSHPLPYPLLHPKRIRKPGSMGISLATNCLIFNALFTFIGLCLLTEKDKN